MKKKLRPAPVLRTHVHTHEIRRPGHAPLKDPAWSGKIFSHIEKYLGYPDLTVNSRETDVISVDIHVVYPTDERPYLTLVSTGMSAAPMRGPDCGPLQFERAELIMYYSPDAFREFCEDCVAHWWPVRLLRDLATLPHRHDTYLGCGHSIETGDAPPGEFGPCAFNSTMLLHTGSEDAGFNPLALDCGRTVPCFLSTPKSSPSSAVVDRPRWRSAWQLLAIP